MIILALDSALMSCSAAILKDGEIISELYEDRQRGQAERLLPMCQDVCRTAEISFDDLTAIAVTKGPGTFTGVRIGLPAAKGLALALNIPLIGVTTLDVVAQNAALKMQNGRLAVIHDARRSEVYIQIYEVQDHLAKPLFEPKAHPVDKVGEMLEGAEVMVGTGVEVIKDFLEDKMLEKLSFPDISRQPQAGILGQIAINEFKQGKGNATVKPLYLRAPDAIAAKPITYPFQNQ